MQPDRFPSHITEDTTESRDITRWVSLAAATAVMAHGIRRRSPFGFFLAAAATPLAYRAIAGGWPRLLNWGDGDSRLALSGGGGIPVTESVSGRRPVDEVFAFWRDFEPLPRFMTHLERVTNLGGGRSHWVAKGPAGSSVEWDAEII